MKILFIGGTGNISRSVSQKTLGMGHDLWLLNRSGQTIDCGGKKTNIIQGSIDDPSIESQLSAHQWDVVVNWVGFTPEDAKRDIRIFGGKTRQYIFISSASCYQNPHSNLYITEQTPLENPYWQYSRDKIAAEKALYEAHQAGKLPVTIVRPSHTYSTVIPITLGGWNEYTAVARMKQGLPVVVQGDGTSLWTLTHADDFAKGFVGLYGADAAMGEAFHITSDEVLNWNQIYELTANAVGKSADIVHVTSDTICTLDPDYIGTLLGDKAVSALFDNTKIKTITPSYNATIKYAEGIKRTIEWFEADPERQIISAETNAFIEHLIQTAS